MPARKGELHHKARLTEEQVREIRRLRTEEGLSYQRIAEEMDWVAELATIFDVVNRRTWRHVP